MLAKSESDKGGYHGYPTLKRTNESFRAEWDHQNAEAGRIHYACASVPFQVICLMSMLPSAYACTASALLEKSFNCYRHQVFRY
jgi:hypothetical protein